MGITVEAIYESGVLKPLKPLDTLQEHERVRITVQPSASLPSNAANASSSTRQLLTKSLKSPESNCWRVKYAARHPAGYALLR